MVSGERSYFFKFIYSLYNYYGPLGHQKCEFPISAVHPCSLPLCRVLWEPDSPRAAGAVLWCGAPQTHTCAQQRVLTGTWKLQRFGSVQKLLQLHHQTSWLSLQEQGASHVCSVHLLRVMFAPPFHPLPSLACSVLSFSVVLWGS